jgi:hypothetical protein
LGESADNPETWWIDVVSLGDLRMPTKPIPISFLASCALPYHSKGSAEVEVLCCGKNSI